MTASDRALVLLVDDEPKVLESLSRGLRKQPYDLAFAESAAEALAQFKKTPPVVIVCDQQMPGTSGTELLAVVSERWPRTMRIMLTGTADVEVAKDAVNVGHVHRFLTKPVPGFELAFEIRKAIELHAVEAAGREMLETLQRVNDVIEELTDGHPELAETMRRALRATRDVEGIQPEDRGHFLDLVGRELDRLTLEPSPS